MDQKGFTLVEIIAMLVVLGILMLIAIPNISGIVKNNRESIIVQDVDRMVRNAESMLQMKSAAYPSKKNYCGILTLDFLDTNNDFKEGMNGGIYDKSESFVLVRKEEPKSGSKIYSYKYYVRLFEEKGDTDYVTDLVLYENFSSEPKKYLKSYPSSGVPKASFSGKYANWSNVKSLFSPSVSYNFCENNSTISVYR